MYVPWSGSGNISGWLIRQAESRLESYITKPGFVVSDIYIKALSQPPYPPAPSSFWSSITKLVNNEFLLKTSCGNVMLRICRKESKMNSITLHNVILKNILLFSLS